MTNRLAAETSPYLRQHADNPVDWYPWGDEALAAAADRDVPILLSVGYSACHWCHVMAHESFENDDIAARMNASFVNIKVDREERPDIDALYMDAVQAMTGRGGWPMTVVMTPTGEPFFAGTYFPPESSRGMPGFADILDSLAESWANHRSDIDDHAASVAAVLVEAAEVERSQSLPSQAALSAVAESLTSIVDSVNGGWGTAPKFPSPMLVDVLLRHHVRTGAKAALAAATLTLDRMATGGIYDHLGGGFARYSVDGEWAVPHFEKMLYDNALAIPAYLHSWQITGSVDHRQVVEETIEYVLRDLRLAGGGIASAEDADSEGEEGRFYVWDYDDLVDRLSGEELELAVEWYGVSEAGNFEGTNVLHRPASANLKRSTEAEALRKKLFERRLGRVRPGLDDKVLVEWNALMASALAEAGAVLLEPRWVEAAVEILEFLEINLVDSAGRWHRSWQVDGGRRHLAYAADYAALVDAYTRLGEATGHRRWHESALTLARSMIDLFWDPAQGGLFTTGSDAEELLVRRKDLFDSPTPSANGNASLSLLRLAAIHGRLDLADRAEEILHLTAAGMEAQPQAHARFLAALDLAQSTMSEIVISGERPDLLGVVTSRYLPTSVLLHGEPFDSPVWEGRTARRAYVCENYACGLPADRPEELAAQLDDLTAPS